jgi:hypothetical protein
MYPYRGQRAPIIPPGVSVLDRIVRAMEPGAWYARSDLRCLARLSKSEIMGVQIFSHGYLSRLPNPEYKTVTNLRHLYTLTAAGLARRLLLLEIAKAESNRDAG